jgi:hypothetical protein
MLPSSSRNSILDLSADCRKRWMAVMVTTGALAISRIRTVFPAVLHHQAAWA